MSSIWHPFGSIWIHLDAMKIQIRRNYFRFSWPLERSERLKTISAFYREKDRFAICVPVICELIETLITATLLGACRPLERLTERVRERRVLKRKKHFKNTETFFGWLNGFFAAAPVSTAQSVKFDVIPALNHCRRLESTRFNLDAV